jgi:enamine deaminase RidA (YjgF/YER057c/UK114 family)
MTERRHARSGSPFEARIGFSRAVRQGPHVAVSGTAPIGTDGKTVGVGDAEAQATRCLEIIREALARVDAPLESVFRTRIYLVRLEDWEAIARAHGACFGKIRPASTFVQVKGLLDPDWLVEIEADALLPEEGDGL